MIIYLLSLALTGLVVGAFARLALPGKDPLSIWQTMAVGIAGSFIAGMAVYFATDGTHAGGFLAALLVSMAIMYVIRRRRGGGLTDPGVAPQR